ncbi:MAG TPA: SCO family protein [Candidatus Acidoferrales bacterium]|jgi:protein SCO1/2|nr:SCO family protein [Candidatus Acidoferrales bacterium]
MKMTNRTRKLFGGVLFATAGLLYVSLVAACSSGGESGGKRYALTGRVTRVDRSTNTVIVDGDPIPGYMDAMEMPYQVKDPKMLDPLAVGDQIKADVVVTSDGAHLENIVVTKKGDATKAPSAGAQHEPQPGEAVPDFLLINENGKQIHLHDFRGKTVLLTFIYTRCPLPDYCPLMSYNFAQIEKDLAKDAGEYKETHLLSISFDPKFDTPKVLRGYGEEYLKQAGDRNFDHWEFVSAPIAEMPDLEKFFGVFVDGENAQIVHSMSTAVIGPDGKVYRWYHGNDWQTADVLRDVVSSLPHQATIAAVK